MALQKDYSYKGLPLPDAYWKIESVGVTVSKLTAAVMMGVYADQEQAADPANAFEFVSFDLAPPEMAALTGKQIPDMEIPQIEAANPLEWCYKWLALKPEFAEAKDV